MRLSYAVFFILFLNIPLFAQNEGIIFEDTNWSEILVKAENEDKLIFLDAYASWCGPCKWMDANVFPDKKVGDFMNEHFVNAKIDMEKGEGPELAKKYGVRAYPTYLIVNDKGTLVHRFCGSMEADKFLQNTKVAMDGDSNFAAIVNRYESSELNKDLALIYFKTLDNACMNSKSKAGEVYDQLSQDLATLKHWSEFIASYPPAYDSDFFNYTRENYDELSGDHKTELLTGLQDAVKSYLTTMLRSDQYTKALEEIESLDIPTNEARAEVSYYYFRQKKDWENFMKAAEVLASGPQSDNPVFLNGAAWTVYENVDDEESIKTALGWIRRSVAIEKNYPNMDTYAALLFKSGEKEKGREVALEAIELAKTSGIDYEGTTELIKKYSE